MLFGKTDVQGSQKKKRGGSVSPRDECGAHKERVISPRNQNGGDVTPFGRRGNELETTRCGKGAVGAGC